MKERRICSCTSPPMTDPGRYRGLTRFSTDITPFTDDSDAPGASSFRGLVGPVRCLTRPPPLATSSGLGVPGRSTAWPASPVRGHGTPANRLIDLLTAHYPAYEQTTPCPITCGMPCRWCSCAHRGAGGTRRDLS